MESSCISLFSCLDTVDPQVSVVTTETLLRTRNERFPNRSRRRAVLGGAYMHRSVPQLCLKCIPSL